MILRKICMVLCFTFLLGLLASCDDVTTDQSFKISFDTQGAEVLADLEVEAGQSYMLPTIVKEGHTFLGWYEQSDFSGLPFTNQTEIFEDIKLYAKWDVNTYEIIYYDFDHNEIQKTSYTFNASLANHNTVDLPIKSHPLFNYVSSKWPDLPEFMPAENLKFYAAYDLVLPMFTQVGMDNVTYLVPSETDDSKEVYVDGGFLMAQTETTYEMWYFVRNWALDNGYTNIYNGKAGSHGNQTGNHPNLVAEKHQPVTQVSIFNVMVWMNALSEMMGYEPIYRTLDGVIIRDSEDIIVLETILIFNGDGYRLPTVDEWGMAARWRNDFHEDAIFDGVRYWTKGSYASGASQNYLDQLATSEVAWYRDAMQDLITKDVGLLKPNALGLYDMSGNAWEWVFDEGSYEYMYLRGGSVYSVKERMRLGLVSNEVELFNQLPYFGFRIVKNIVSS